MQEDMREFVAYSRKLLRILDKLENALENKEYDKALEMVRELKEDTQRDIEAQKQTLRETERAVDLPRPPKFCKKNYTPKGKRKEEGKDAEN